MAFQRHAHRIGAVCYVLWGILHIGAGALVLYRLAASKIGVPDYKSLAQEKLRTAEDLYRFLIDQFHQSRTFVLESLVVLILLIELVYVFHGKM